MEKHEIWNVYSLGGVFEFLQEYGMVIKLKNWENKSCVMQIFLLKITRILHANSILNFDAEEIVKLAKSTGMKYIVFTAKHHDGFSMFDSKFTDYDIVDFTPYKKGYFK